MNPQSLPDRVYYDVVISNLNNVDLTPPIAYFNQTRNTPYLYNPSLYNLIINRWTLDTQTLPIFRPSIQSFSVDVNLTIYSISLSCLGQTVQQYVIYQPQNQVAPVPRSPALQPNGLQDNQTGYYDIYSYGYWISLVNNAFETAFNDLKALVPLGTFPDGVLPPFMDYDSNTQKCSLFVNEVLFGVDAVNPVSIYFNPAMAQLFSSFPFLIKNLSSVNGLNYLILTTLSKNIVDGIIQVEQELPTIGNWNPVMSICLLSNSLGIVPNNEGQPALYVNGVLINGNGNNSNIANLITDFTADSVFKSNIVYNPSAEFRRIDLIGDQPLNNLDISIFWKDREGALNPYRLPVGGTATIKFLFEKKGLHGKR
jgi:hypothetical protein